MCAFRDVSVKYVACGMWRFFVLSAMLSVCCVLLHVLCAMLCVLCDVCVFCVCTELYVSVCLFGCLTCGRHTNAHTPASHHTQHNNV